MFRSKIIPATLASIVALGTAHAAFAVNGANQTDEQQEAAAVQNAKTSLVQAITAAEQHTGGKAIDISIEDHDDRVIGYHVKVAKGNTVQEVLVDLNTGQVLKVTANASEDDEDGEHEDE